VEAGHGKYTHHTYLNKERIKEKRVKKGERE